MNQFSGFKVTEHFLHKNLCMLNMSQKRLRRGCICLDKITAYPLIKRHSEGKQWASVDKREDMLRKKIVMVSWMDDEWTDRLITIGLPQSRALIIKKWWYSSITFWKSWHMCRIILRRCRFKFVQIMVPRRRVGQKLKGGGNF